MSPSRGARSGAAWLGAMAILALGAAPARALTEWRTQVQVSLGAEIDTQFAFDGGPNQPAASQTLATTLVLHLTADIVGSNDLAARVYLSQDEGFEFRSDSGTILFESTSQLWPGFEGFAHNPGPDDFDVLLGNAPGSVDATRAFDFTVDPGDSLHVWARLVGTADQPGEVDAFSTLTASLTNIAGFAPATVPEPGTPALFLAGLLGIGWVGRSRGR